LCNRDHPAGARDQGAPSRERRHPASLGGAAPALAILLRLCLQLYHDRHLLGQPSLHFSPLPGQRSYLRPVERLLPDVYLVSALPDGSSGRIYHRPGPSPDGDHVLRVGPFPTGLWVAAGVALWERPAADRPAVGPTLPALPHHPVPDQHAVVFIGDDYVL